MVRERYLRNDITCQIRSCCGCPKQTKESLDSQVQYVVIPDADTTVAYLELFETLKVTGLIFTQTVMEAVDGEMRLSNRKAIIRRVRRLTEDGRRSSATFSNEFYEQTHYTGPPCQKASERRDFAVAKFAAWFTAHVDKFQSLPVMSPILFITDKPEVAEWAKKEGVKNVLTMKDYMIGFFGEAQYKYYETLKSIYEDAKERRLVPKIAPSVSSEERNPYVEYTDYLGEDVLDAGIKSGLFFRGKLQVSTHRSKEAIVKIHMPYGPVTAIIPGECLRNRAFHGDRVVVVPVSAEDVHQMFPDYRNTAVHFARVVGVESVGRRKFVCTLKEDATAISGSYLVAVPWDRRIPTIKLKSRHYAEIVKVRMLVQVDEWDIDSRTPSGHYVSALGELGLHETEMQVLLHEAQVDTAPFAPAIIEALPKQPWTPKINDPSLGPRRDLTQLRTYSIDPPGCQDIDDALSYRTLTDPQTGRKIIELGVHIADVAAFVPEGSKLDLEAQARGTSVYLPDRRIDMLPTLLSERLCSLRVGEPRYALSVLWHMDMEGNVLDTWYGRTLIKTIHEMCYADAQAIIDGGEKESAMRAKFPKDYDLLRTELLGLRHIFHCLREIRQINGALELETVEVNFVLDAESKRPQKVATKESLEVHALVAEFMIFANCAVAEFLATHLPDSAMLRRHPLPNEDNFGEVIELARSRGLEIDFSSNYALAQSLHRAESFGDRMFTYTLRNLTTLAMAEAEYMSAGSCAAEEFYHYGLAAEFYTHFTSPIRRYADLVVHRQLIAVLAQLERDQNAFQSRFSEQPQYGGIMMPGSQVQSIADHLNFKNRQAKEVQRNSRGLYQNMYFATRQNQDATEVGVVVAIRTNGIMLYFPKYGYNCHLALKDSSNVLLNSSSSMSMQKPTHFAPDAFPEGRSGENTMSNENQGGDESMLESFMRAADESEMILNTSSGTHVVRLFDRVSLKIGVTPNRYHMDKVELRSLRFETESYEKLDKWYNPPVALSLSSSTGIRPPISTDTETPTVAEDSTSAPYSSVTAAYVTPGNPELEKEEEAAKTSAKMPTKAPKSLTPKDMIAQVHNAERKAKTKMAETMMSKLPSNIKEAAKSRVSPLYRWCQFEFGQHQLRMDPLRALTAFVLSRRVLLPIASESSKIAKSSSPSVSSTLSSPNTSNNSLLRKIRRPVCIHPRKTRASGKHTWKREEYDAYIEKMRAYHALGTGPGEEEDEENSNSSPLPGVDFGPSASFGVTRVTAQSQQIKLTRAAAEAERKFRKEQAQVGKAKFASRHY